MKKSRFSDEQIVGFLRQAEAGMAVKELLARMVRDLVALGKNRLFLGCSPDPNSRSYGFYRHLGWQSTGQFDRHGDELLELRVPQPKERTA